MRHAYLTLAAAVAVVGFVGVVLVVYHGQPTPGAVFLTMGWMAILATGYFLVRAVSSFELEGGRPEIDVAAARDDLVREKKLLLKAIKEIEFDRDMGKLDNSEAERAILRYRARAVEILRLLDDGRGESDVQKSYEVVIEKELARRLAVGGCAACAAVNDDDAAFCKKCGARLRGGQGS